ncbi:MAG: L,D-transpeptidase family protein [Arcicella sp.]|nr:L,D-transpeptidase family protein [Arcicella sp.]
MMFSIPENFKSQQLKYERVKAAYDEKSEAVFTLLKQHHISPSQLRIFIRVFKQDEILEVWAKENQSPRFELLKTYQIASSSGNLGPKRKQGDMQTPEGFYYIDRFNPISNFYLSLGVNYPNTSDKILGEKGNYGGDIFIHGATVTVGCMPMTDDKIKEIYLTAVEAKNAGQTAIPVHIFPTKLTDSGMVSLQKTVQSASFIGYWQALKNGQNIDYQKFIKFWTNLKEGYDYFEQHHQLPQVSVKKTGEYTFTK